MKPKIIIYGAGELGVQASYYLEEQYNVTAFVDGNPKKQNQTFFSIPIVSPEQLRNLEYDYIYLSLVKDFSKVCAFLINDLLIPEEKILSKIHMDWKKTIRTAMLKRLADEIYDNELEGCVAELGVYTGHFAAHINNIFHDRKLYLFDTFDGFDQRDIKFEIQNEFSDAIKGELKYSDIESVLNRMKYPSNCIVKKGYFPETAVDVEESFVFVSIDVDLYTPIYEGLKYFYPRLVEGGYICIHDYTSMRFHGAKKAVKDFCKEYNAKLVPAIDFTGSAIIVK